MKFLIMIIASAVSFLSVTLIKKIPIGPIEEVSWNSIQNIFLDILTSHYFYFATVSYVCSAFFFFYVIYRYEIASTMSTLMAIYIIMINILSVLFVNEAFSVKQGIGIFLIIFGIFLVN